jgi:SAM-dependent methyltransferase
MDDPSMLRAYLDYYWPVSREQARHALATSALIARFRGETQPAFRTVIDVGSGPGPVAAAFVDAGAADVFLIDQSRAALDLALAEIPRRCGRDAAISALAIDITKPDPARVPQWGRATCVSFGHSLNELWAGAPDRIERRANLLERYAGALAPCLSSSILIIEPALLSTSRDLLAVRDLLVGRGWRVLAPCVGRESLPCPALSAGEQHTCHEDVCWRVPPSVAALAETRNVDKEYLKMTWFLLAPPTVGAAASISGQTLRSAGGNFFRVVSEAMLNKGGRLRRLVCGTDGRFPLSVAADSVDSERTGFPSLRRGDIVSIENPQVRENGWGIGTETRVGKKE